MRSKNGRRILADFLRNARNQAVEFHRNRIAGLFEASDLGIDVLGSHRERSYERDASSKRNARATAIPGEIGTPFFMTITIRATGVLGQSFLEEACDINGWMDQRRMASRLRDKFGLRHPLGQQASSAGRNDPIVRRDENDGGHFDLTK